MHGHVCRRCDNEHDHNVQTTNTCIRKKSYKDEIKARVWYAGAHYGDCVCVCVCV